MPDGPNAGTKINKEDFESALNYYYELAGWDNETENPTEETIKKLDWIGS